jgi:hypothetical protein
MPGWKVTREGPVLLVFLSAVIAPSEWEPLLDDVEAAINNAGDRGIALVDLRESVHSSSNALRGTMVESLIGLPSG